MSTLDTVDHEALYAKRFVDYFRNNTNLRALFDIEAAQLQEVEDGAIEVRDKLLAPGGAWLDIVGRILNVDRDGMDDTDYTAAMELRRQAMKSHGTVPDLLDLADAISDKFEVSPPATTYQRVGMLSFVLTMQLDAAHHPLAQRLLTDAKPAGREGSVEIAVTPSIGFGGGASGFGTGRFGTGFTLE